MIEALTALEQHVAKIQIELKVVKEKITELRKEVANNTAPAEQPAAAAKPRSELEELTTLLHSDAWPHAINPKLICDLSSEQDVQDRAEGIIDIIIDVHLGGLRFLDFGCGEGHVVSRSKHQNPELAIGFDIVESARWAEFASENTKFTSLWDDVVKNGPYNVILLYDVIDHVIEEDPTVVLRRLKPLLRPNGKVYVRCHPYTSRHTTHLYHTINKAYIHLIFTDAELKEMGYTTVQKARKIIHPLITYNDIFAKAGFSLAGQPQVQRETVEPFFVNNPKIAERIKANWAESPDTNLRTGAAFPFVQMEQQFLDYVLL